MKVFGDQHDFRFLNENMIGGCTNLEQHNSCRLGKLNLEICQAEVLTTAPGWKLYSNIHLPASVLVILKLVQTCHKGRPSNY